MTELHEAICSHFHW